MERWETWREGRGWRRVADPVLRWEGEGRGQQQTPGEKQCGPRVPRKPQPSLTPNPCKCLKEKKENQKERGEGREGGTEGGLAWGLWEGKAEIP